MERTELNEDLMNHPRHFGNDPGQNRLLWLGRFQPDFMEKLGTKGVEGQKRKLQVSTGSANESLSPLSNPINIHAQ